MIDDDRDGDVNDVDERCWERCELFFFMYLQHRDQKQKQLHTKDYFRVGVVFKTSSRKQSRARFLYLEEERFLLGKWWKVTLVEEKSGVVAIWLLVMSLFYLIADLEQQNLV